jgi:hypothetical protein
MVREQRQSIFTADRIKNGGLYSCLKLTVIDHSRMIIRLCLRFTTPLPNAAKYCSTAQRTKTC